MRHKAGLHVKKDTSRYYHSITYQKIDCVIVDLCWDIMYHLMSYQGVKLSHITSLLMGSGLGYKKGCGEVTPVQRLLENTTRY